MSTDTEELKALIAQSLESKGILGKLKAQLRASVVTAIHEYEGLGGVYQENVGAKKIHDHMEAQIGLGLVCEFLEYYGFQYTLSVLLPEANMAERNGLPGPDQVSQFLRFNPSGKPQPLLVDLVTNIKSPSSILHGSSLSPHASYPQSPRGEPPASPRSPRAQPTHWPTKPIHAPLTSPPSSVPTIKKLAIPSLSVPTQPAPHTLKPQSQLSPHTLLSPPQSHTQLQSQPQPQMQPPQPQQKPQQPQPSQLKPATQQPAPLTTSSKNKEAAYLSYPEGDDDEIEDVDEDIDGDLDLDGDLDFEDDEDLEIDATPAKPSNSVKADFGKAPQTTNTPATASKTPLSNLSQKPSSLSSSSKDSNSSKKDTKSTNNYKFDLDSDEDQGSLADDMKRLEVLEQTLNRFTNKPQQQQPQPQQSVKINADNNSKKSDLDDLDSIGSDYSNEFEEDDALTADHSISSGRSSVTGEYDHEEAIDHRK